MSDGKVISDEDAPVEAPTPTEVEYIVLREIEVDAPQGHEKLAGLFITWEQIAIIKAPPRTKRKSLIAKALAKAAIVPKAGMPPLRVRVLDVDSARVHEVPVVVAEPRFEI